MRPIVAPERKGNERKMQVCVVGATGVLGRSLVPTLVKEGFAVRALARFNEQKRRSLPNDAHCVNFDLLSGSAPDELPGLLRGFDAVLHIATAIPKDFNAPGAWDLNNQLRTVGVQRLLDASLASGVPYYIQQSITMRYPDLGDQWIDEDTPLVATSGSTGEPDTVTVMENLVRNADKKLDWCILRGAIFVGPGTFQEGAIQRLRSGSEVVPGNGMNFVSLVHVEDMASAFVRALHVRPHRAVYNIVTESLREGEYRDRLADVIGVERPVRDGKQPNPVSHRCSNRRAQAELQWKPQHSIFPSP